MKEYGKLTLDQFKAYVGKLPEVRQQMDELPTAIRECDPKKLDCLLEPDFFWAEFYELPFTELIALLLMALGKVAWLRDVAAQPDPQQLLLDSLEDDEEWSGPAAPFDYQDVVGLVLILQRNVLSIMLYHRTVSALVAEVRDGNIDSLFKAVRIDRSIVACPSIAARIARAELVNDKAFFLHLKSALKGPSKKHWEAYRDLRYSLCVLRELGIDTLSDAQLERLLVDELKLYSPSPTARKNLRKQFNESKKFSTT